MANHMGSINAQQAGTKVSASIRKGEKVVLAKILQDVGYSHSITRKPSMVTKTKSYKQALAVEQKPLIERLQREINEIEQALAKKNKDDEEYRVLIASLDVLIKNYQLLSGGATERQVFVLPSEVIQKNAIAPQSEQTLLADGSTKPDNGSTEPRG